MGLTTGTAGKGDQAGTEEKPEPRTTGVCLIRSQGTKNRNSTPWPERMGQQERETMSEFKNVTVVREANVYFDGKVTSRTVLFPDGTKKTLGIMLPGEYEFGTGSEELMEILTGDLEVLLPGKTAWKRIKGGESFRVSAQSRFGLKVKGITDYCCSYIS